APRRAAAARSRAVRLMRAVGDGDARWQDAAAEAQSAMDTAVHNAMLDSAEVQRQIAAAAAGVG
ncbi:MAG: hypothetical protein VYE81_05890, partial [Planctomycetota bacterium]|nr:hypothetical protein [Planctomycetota bacterium]